MTTDIDRSFFSLICFTSYFSVLNRKYRSLQCTWSLAYDYSWYLITANITIERLMHLVLFLLFLLYLSIWHYMYTDKKSQFVWFWRYFSQLNGYRYQYQWVEKNHCITSSVLTDLNFKKLTKSNCKVCKFYTYIK